MELLTVNRYGRGDVPFETILGKTLTNYTKTDDRLDLYFTDGSAYAMFHVQECCESVEIEDICGDLDSLIDHPLTMAEESSNSDVQPGQDSYYNESFTWTFYKMATINGYVTIRWFGASNGYYSEAVEFQEVTSPNPIQKEGE